MQHLFKSKILTAAGGVLAIALTGCAYMYYGWTCPPGESECHYEIGVRGVICENGAIVPENTPCPVDEIELPPPEQNVIKIDYSANHSLSINPISQSGTLELYEDEVLDTIFSVQFNKVGNSQFVTDPAAVQSSVVSAMSSNSDYSFTLRPPAVEVSTGASGGELVSLTASLYANDVMASTVTSSYVAGPEGGYPTIMQGPNQTP